MRLFSRILLAAAFAASAFAADVVGKWIATAQGPNGALKMEFTFTRTGDTLSGTALTPVGDLPISDVKLEGDKISFVVMNGKFKVVHEGTISGDEMKLKIHNVSQTLDAVAKRATP